MLARIQFNGKEECFYEIKKHKPNFENNATARLIDAAKNGISRVSKVKLKKH